MGSVYHVSGRVSVGVAVHMEAASEADALQDYMVMVETFIHEGLRDDDVVSDFRWTDVHVQPRDRGAD